MRATAPAGPSGLSALSGLSGLSAPAGPSGLSEAAGPSGLSEAVAGAGAEHGRELRPALRHIAAGAVSVTGARYAVLTVLDPEHGLVGEVFAEGLDPAERDRIARPPCGPDRFGERLRTAFGTRTGSGAPAPARAGRGAGRAGSRRGRGTLGERSGNSRGPARAPVAERPVPWGGGAAGGRGRP